MNSAIENDCLVVPDLLSFLKENDFTGFKLKLLLFWGRHPQAKFNLDCIAHVLETSRHQLHTTLGELIDKDMVKENYCSSGIAHYSLNQDHVVNHYASELSKLDWSVIKNLEVALEGEAVLA